jgi:hypothetical protein
MSGIVEDLQLTPTVFTPLNINANGNTVAIPAVSGKTAVLLAIGGASTTPVTLSAVQLQTGASTPITQYMRVSTDGFFAADGGVPIAMATKGEELRIGAGSDGFRGYAVGAYI